jgi:hypothetical protein
VIVEQIEERRITRAGRVPLPEPEPGEAPEPPEEES